MRTKSFIALAIAGVLGPISMMGCDLDVPDLNNPGLEELENTPTAVKINAACTGLLIGNRRNVAAGNGYVAQLGILGREAYNFDSADPRYFGELLQGELNQGSPFGGNFWALPYGNIRLGNVILRAVDKVPAGELDDTAKSGIRGFVHTIEALDLLEVVVTHDTNGAVIDQPAEVDALGPIVDSTAAYKAIAGLLDTADGELMKGGESFTFLMASGYNGFDSPAGFRKLNRAIRARVAVYMKEYQVALDVLPGSFIAEADPIDFDLGVYHTFTTKSGDATNGLINPNIYAHPSLQTAAHPKADADPDNRFTRKVAASSKSGSNATAGVSSSLRFTMYQQPDSPVPIIRNEELILLKAEALFFTGKKTEAIDELNLVHTKSGGLDPLVHTVPPSDAIFIDELLYERRYSLLFEGGHRWIDLRRFGRELPLDAKAEGKDPDVRNVRYPIPLPECNARPGEPRCELGSL